MFSFLACLDPGDEIIVPEPAYANYMAFAISAGATIKTLPSSINEGFALPAIDKFEALITKLSIYFVRKEKQIIFFYQIPYLVHLFLGI